MNPSEPAQARKGRETNYDLLRLIACAAVVVLHVGASYWDAYFDPAFFGVLYSEHLMMSVFAVDLGRFAVPCFFMLSGAFILSSSHNAEFRYFYRKAFRSIGVQALVFSFLYFLWSVLLTWRAVLYKGADISCMWLPLLRLLKGAPYLHLWYLYVLFGLYLLAPLVIRFRLSVSAQSFSRVAWVFFLAAAAGLCTSTHLLYWDPGVWFRYLGYFMLGYCLRSWAHSRKSNGRGICLITAGLLVEIALSWLHTEVLLENITDPLGWEPLFGEESPVIALASVLIFAGFSLLEMPAGRGRISRMAEKTFLIYLIHASVWDVIASRIVRRYWHGFDSRIAIPLASAAVLAVSYGLAMLYQAIWNAAGQKLHITDRLCRALHLE